VQGKSKGCAFLTYESKQDADKAIRQLDNQVAIPTDARGRLLTVKYANSAAAAAVGMSM
jgi:CUG-BP- and ETR3-like factor